MRSRHITARAARRLLPVLAAALLLAVLAAPAIARATAAPTTPQTGIWPTTSTTVAQAGGSPGTTAGPTGAATQTTTGPASASSTPTTAPPSGQGAQSTQAIIPPSSAQEPLNGSWKSDQMEIRVMPEYDQPAVLVIEGFSIPADVPLPTTVKFPIPAGAHITGIGEVDPNGNFQYNYTTSYPPVEQGTEWDIASIQVKTYHKLQVDYYYDPGLPQGAGPRSIPVWVQVPVDAGQLLLHIQQPARSTDFQVQPALQQSGKAGDGYTYSVAAYTDVKAGSVLGHTVSYTKSDGNVSTDTSQQAGKVSTNTVLLTAILIIVVIVGGLVLFRIFFSSRKRGPQKGKGKGQGSATQKTVKQQPAAKASNKGAISKNAAGKNASAKTRAGDATTQAEAASALAFSGAATPASDAAVYEDREAAAQTPTPTDEGTPIDAGTMGAATVSAEDVPGSTEYCVACGEELSPDSPFCPNCGEARR